MKHRPVWRGFVLFLIALVSVTLDRYTKHLVRTHLPLRQSWNPIPWLDPIFTFTHIRNTGAAFGLFANMNIVFVFIALAVIVVIIIYYRQLATASWVLQVALGLQLGGAVGNMIDRILYGYVTDFIDFRVWPVFNLADASIVMGTILLAYYALFVERSPKRGETLTERSEADAGEASKS